MSDRNPKPAVIIISGPSGVGKGTICRELVKRLDNVYLSVSVTTRTRGREELEGKEYFFITDEQFEERINNGLLLEYARVFDNYYGTPRDKTDQALAAGKTVILEIDVQGARQAKDIYPDAIAIFILPPNRTQLVERIDGRGREDSETARKRLERAEGEIAQAKKFYDDMVVNDDLDQAVEEVINIINKGIGDK